LAPAARRRAQIENPRAFLEKAEFLIQLDQLEGGAAALTARLCGRDIGIVELTLQPGARGLAAPAILFDFHRHTAASRGVAGFHAQIFI
jgi:hypothetical protein